jgi:hypothetical protein
MDHVYVRAQQALRLYARGQPDRSIAGSGPERIAEIRQCWALLPMELWRDPVFTISSTNWDMFASWEWDVEHWAGYLGDRDWDHN